MRPPSTVNAFIIRFRPLLHYITRLVLGVALVIIPLYAFLSIAEDVANNDPIVRFDTIIVNAIHGNISPSLVEVMRLISLAGSEIPTVLTIVIVLYYFRKKAWFELLLIVTGVGGSYLMNSLLKSVFHRDRPTFTDPIASVVGFSFPSGHSMGAMAFYGLMGFLLMRGSSRWSQRIAIGAAMGVIVLLVGFSRVYLGAHYPSDVVAGYAAGLAWLGFTIGSAQALLNWNKRQSARSVPPLGPTHAKV